MEKMSFSSKNNKRKWIIKANIIKTICNEKTSSAWLANMCICWGKKEMIERKLAS